MRWSTSGAIAGTNCIALAPVPDDRDPLARAGRRRGPSATSGTTGPANVSRPSMSGTEGRFSIPTALIDRVRPRRAPRVPSAPRSRSVHRAAVVVVVGREHLGAEPDVRERRRTPRRSARCSRRARRGGRSSRTSRGWARTSTSRSGWARRPAGRGRCSRTRCRRRRRSSRTRCTGSRPARAGSPRTDPPRPAPMIATWNAVELVGVGRPVPHEPPAVVAVEVRLLLDERRRTRGRPPRRRRTS